MFLGNSSHVADLAFFLAGKPKRMNSFLADPKEWHPSGITYAGAGITENGTPFSYQANWGSPGRWGIEILTGKHRLIFKPLEKLQIQEMKSIKIQEIEIQDNLDKEFKPGLYREVESFLREEPEKFGMCTIEEQINMMDVYHQISGEEI